MTVRPALLAIGVGLAATTWSLGDEKNLLPDPGFEKTLALTAEPPKDVDPYDLWSSMPWHHHVIEAPSEVRFEQGAATVSGGKGFLHSAAFDVEAGKTYEFRCKARGGGKIGAGFLWWTRHDDEGLEMSDPHWTRAEEAATTADEPREISVRFAASPNATRAYVRLVATEGSVRISEVMVVEAKPQ